MPAGWASNARTERIRYTHHMLQQSEVASEIVTSICSRRSIRREFSIQSVPRPIIADIIRCGLSAPSSKNAQPWRFHVVNDRETLGYLADEVQNSQDAETYVPVDPATGAPRDDWPSTVSESAGVLRQVPLGIFVENQAPFSGGRAVIAAADKANLAAALVGYTFEVIGLGAAIQNMWIAAQAAGVRGVFMGDVVIAEHAIATRLGMAGDLVGVLALGYTDGMPWRDRFQEPDRVVWH